MTAAEILRLVVAPWYRMPRDQVLALADLLDAIHSDAIEDDDGWDDWPDVVGGYGPLIDATGEAAP